MYANWQSLRDIVSYDFEGERRYRYPRIFNDEAIDHFCDFISRVWQSHPFREGNTRTTAVFSDLYLRSMGFDVSNDRFAENVLYFRDALVRAGYSSIREGIRGDHSFINDF